jgi:hypothetical protein
MDQDYVIKRTPRPSDMYSQGDELSIQTVGSGMNVQIAVRSGGRFTMYTGPKWQNPSKQHGGAIELRALGKAFLEIADNLEDPNDE